MLDANLPKYARIGDLLPHNNWRLTDLLDDTMDRAWEIIKRLPIDDSKSDSIVWKPDKSGRFSTKVLGMQ